MLTPEIFELRQRCTVDYIRALEEARALTWQELRVRAVDRIEKFVLCHPGWLPVDPVVRAGLGLRAFRLSEKRGRCQASRLWGYDCPLGEHRIEADHAFPHALGGPAIGANLVWLCQLHNQWKSSDLLAYYWEDGEPPWLGEQIDRIELVIAPGSRLDI